MIKRFIYALLLIAVLPLFTGCNSPEVFTEAMQLKKNEKIYTRFNIWYTNPQTISSMNYINGKILPFGSEVDVASVNVSRISCYSDVWDISFKTVGSQTKYTVVFDEQMMMQDVETYIKRLFTKQNRKQLSKGISKEFLREINRGRVISRMNRDEVLLTYGYPPPPRTFSLKNDTWIYQEKQFASRRIIFRGGKVRSIIDMED